LDSAEERDGLMTIGVRTYRTLSGLTIVLLVVVVAFATLGRWIETAVGLISMVLMVVAQALLLHCPHCGGRPGLRILGIWTLLLDYELYLADVLLLRHCPRCGKSLAQAEAPSG